MPLTTNVSDLATAVGTELKSHKVLINGNAVDLSALTTTTKTDLVAAVNEVNASLEDLEDAVASASGIDDTQVSTATSWSSSKTSGEISAASTTDRDRGNHTGTQPVASLSDFASAVDARIETRLDVSTADLDTFREVAAALADQDSAVAGINTALGNRVRVDTAQAFNDTQKGQGRDNIGAASAADLGNLAGFDPVAAFEAALQS